jgi:hypothetical protein
MNCRRILTKRRARVIRPSSRLLQEIGWTVDDLEMARAYGFPSAVGYTVSGWVNPLREAIYSRTQINAWLERFQAFAVRVPKVKV